MKIKLKNILIVSAVLIGLVLNFQVSAELSEDCQALLSQIERLTEESKKCTDIECYSEILSKLRKSKDDLPGCRASLESENIQLDKRMENLELEIQWLETQIGTKELEIEVKQKEIAFTELEIYKLIQDIENKEKEIQSFKSRIGDAIKIYYEYDNQNLLKLILGNSNLSDFFDEVVYVNNLQDSILSILENLKIEKNNLEQMKKEKEEKKQQISEAQRQLVVEKSILDYQQRQQNELLDFSEGTKEENEAKIKELVQKQREVLTQIYEIEDKLSKVSFPVGTLFWPLDPNNRRVTQEYGCVDCSWGCPYPQGGCPSGMGFHNGMDIAPNPPGSNPEIFAASDGVVFMTGKGKYFGNWVAVKDSSGLITLYAHLLLINVSPGQQVTAGVLTAYKQGTGIGYMGSTGFSTGSHLHFGVYYFNFGVTDTGDPFGSHTDPRRYLK